jgi:hypothetical protein
LSTSSQDSFESNHDQHQANVSQEYPLSIGEILHLLKHEIRDTFKTIAEDNAVNVSMIQDRFHDKICNMKDSCVSFTTVSLLPIDNLPVGSN